MNFYHESVFSDENENRVRLIISDNHEIEFSDENDNFYQLFISDNHK